MPHDVETVGEASPPAAPAPRPIPSSAPEPVAERLRGETAAASRFAEEQYAGATRLAYASDFRRFDAWCASRGLTALPALSATVATYLAAEARDGAKPTTLSRRAAAIRHAHIAAHHPSPLDPQVRAVLKGIRRTIGTARTRKTPLVAERVLKMIDVTPDTLIGARDRAILLLGFAGAFRRSELAALEVRDLDFLSAGLRVTVRRSKGDQEAQGQTVAITRGAQACPVAALRAWLEISGITTGPVFRPFANGGRMIEAPLTAHSIGDIVKWYAEKAGFDPAEFSAHSLRSGFLTSAAMRGATVFQLRAISRHANLDALLDYVRAAEEFRDNAGAGLL
jgi:site-specific recombinase XerD